MTKRVLLNLDAVYKFQAVIDAETDLLCDDDKFYVGEKVDAYLPDSEFYHPAYVFSINTDEYGTLVILDVDWKTLESVT